MKCDIVDCASFTTASELWKCSFCDFKFHSFCSGVRRNYEDRIVQYMVPMCKQCSAHLLTQKEISKALQGQTMSIRKIEGTLEGFEQAFETLDAALSLKGDIDNLKLQIKQLTKCTSSVNVFMVEQFNQFHDKIAELHSSQKKTSQ